MTIAQALRLIGQHRNELTRQQVRTLCGQAIAGDVSGAIKGLYKIIENKRKDI